MRPAVLGVASLLLAIAPAVQAETPRPMDVKSALETSRFFGGGTRFGESDASVVVLSPDHKNYVFAVIRGLLGKDVVQADIMVGDAQTIKNVKPNRVAVLETDAKCYGASQLSCGARLVSNIQDNPIKWLDLNHVGLIWTDAHNIRQVISINIHSHELQYLTASGSNVIEWFVGPSDTIIYTAERAGYLSESKKLATKGFAVTNESAYDLEAGRLSPVDIAIWRGARDEYIKPTSAAAIKIDDRGRGADVMPRHDPAFSPDGQYFVEAATADLVPANWAGYPANVVYDVGAASEKAVDRLFVVDSKSGASRPLWDAPFSGETVKFSPDSVHIAVGPTYIPSTSDVRPGASANSLVDVNVKTGAYEVISRSLPSACKRFVRFDWISTDSLSVQCAEKSVLFRKRVDETWIQEREFRNARAGKRKNEIKFRIVEDENTPPRLVAADKSGLEVQVFDPNPGLLAQFQLGRVDQIEISDRDGRMYRARVYFPVAYEAGHRYPMVIQNSPGPGRSLADFNLYGVNGNGTGPSFSLFVAQALANRGIIVVDVRAGYPTDVLGTPAEWERVSDCYDAIVHYFVDRGLVDVEKVGVTGFSRMNWYVTQTLSHSDTRYAAAVGSSGVDGSYFQEALTPGPLRDGEAGGEMPVGPGLRSWLGASTDFNADRIMTPLLIMSEDSDPLSYWGLFSRLNELGKPVELYVIPDVARGYHGLQNPRQAFRSMQRTVDWFDFWLNNAERAAPIEAAGETQADINSQYHAWKELRARRDAEATKPRRRLIHWVMDAAAP